MNYRLQQRLLGSTALWDPREPAADGEEDFDQDPQDEGDGEEGDEFDDPDDQDDEGDPDGDEDEGDPPAQPRQQSRGQTRFQRLTDERKAEKERADRLQAQLDAMQRQPVGPQKTPQELAAERATKLAGMTAEARLEFLINEQAQTTQHQINQIQFATWDAGDKATFAALSAKNPALAAIEDEVEQRLTELRASGQNASRETVAKYLLGEKALSKASRARTAGRKREQDGRERQGARPVNGRGDVAPNGQRRTGEREARRKRLENMQI